MRQQAARLVAGTSALILAGALLAGGVMGCTPAEPTGVPGITGEITYYAAGTGAATIANITVEGGEQPEGAVSDKAVVAVTEKTAVLDADGQPTDAEALTVGTEVSVWFTGPVAESYPVQGAASRVQVVGTQP